MVRALALAVGQLGDARMVGILLRSLIVTLAAFAAAGLVLWFALDRLVGLMIAADDASALATLLTVAALVLLLWLTFRAVAIAVIGLFGDAVVGVVEQRYYPAAAARARAIPLRRSAVMGLRSVGRLVGYNLLAAPLYVAAAATGIGLPIAFFAVNGVLLGRDLGDMVAVRHVPADDLADWRAATRWPRAGLGLVVGGLFAVPVVNLLAPVIGAAAMTHLFHRARP